MSFCLSVCLSVVFVVTVGGEDQNYHFRVEYTIHEPVLFCYFATPTPFRFTFERFGMTESCLGMGMQLLYKTECFLIGFGLVFSEFEKTVCCLLGISYLINHSRISSTCPLQILRLFAPRIVREHIAFLNYQA